MVYIHDILVFAANYSTLRRVLRAIPKRSRAAGFIMSPKSQTTPVQSICFITRTWTQGEYFFKCARVDKKHVARVGAGRGNRYINSRRLRNVLGQVCLLLRLGAGLPCFMAGSYKALESGPTASHGAWRASWAPTCCSAAWPSATNPTPTCRNQWVEAPPCRAASSSGIRRGGRGVQGGNCWGSGFLQVAALSEMGDYAAARGAVWCIMLASSHGAHMGRGTVMVGTGSEVGRWRTMGMWAAANNPA